MSSVDRSNGACERIMAELDFELSPAVRKELSFALLGSLWANRPWELAITVRPHDARLVMRSHLVEELKGAGLDRLVAQLRDVPPDELALCAFPPRRHCTPWIGAFALPGLKVDARRGRRGLRKEVGL